MLVLCRENCRLFFPYTVFFLRWTYRRPWPDSNQL